MCKLKKSHLIIFAFLISIRFLYPVLFSKEPKDGDDDYTFHRTAVQICETENVVDNFSLYYMDILISLFSAGLYKIFGYNYFYVILFNSIFSLISLFLLLCITRTITNDFRIYLSCLFFVIFYPFKWLKIQRSIFSENLYIPLLIVIVYLGISLVKSEQIENKGKKYINLLLLIIASSMLFFARQTAFVVWAAFMIFYLFFSHLKIKGKSILLLFYFSTSFLLISPMLWLTYKRFGHPTLFVQSSGVNFYLGNNPDATGKFGYPKKDYFGEYIFSEYNLEGKNISIVQREALLKKYVRYYIKNNLLKWFFQTSKKLKMALFCEKNSTFHLIIFFLAIVGLLSGSLNSGKYLLGLIILFHIIPITIFFYHSRYRAVYEPFLAILAASGFITILDIVRHILKQSLHKHPLSNFGK